MTKQLYTTYKTATHWLGGSLILCNDIADVDASIFDNIRFPLYDEEDNYIDIYSYFLTSYSNEDVNWLEKTFGLKFTYSEKLDLYVLCVDHFGTAWDSVLCEVYSKQWAEHNADLLVEV